jgi:hypothetical protein
MCRQQSSETITTARAVGRPLDEPGRTPFGPQKGRERFINNRKQPVTTRKQLSRSAPVLGNKCRSENGVPADFNPRVGGSNPSGRAVRIPGHGTLLKMVTLSRQTLPPAKSPRGVQVGSRDFTRSARGQIVRDQRRDAAQAPALIPKTTAPSGSRDSWSARTRTGRLPQQVTPQCVANDAARLHDDDAAQQLHRTEVRARRGHG